MYKKLPITEHNEPIESINQMLGPRNLIITSFPKSGKTLSLLNVKKILIGDIENGTSSFKKKSNVVNLQSDDNEKFVYSKQYDIYIPKGIFDTVSELYKANNMKKYWELKNIIDFNNNISEKENAQKE